MSSLIMIVRMGTRRRSLRSMALAAVVVALAAAGLSSAILVRQDAAHAVDSAFAAHGGPDLVITTDTGNVDDVQRALSADPRVAGVAPPRRIVDAQADIGDDRVALVVNGLDAEPASRLNPPVLTAGRLPTTTTEIALDTGVANDTGLSLGDSVVVRTRSTQRAFTIVGLGYDFTDCLFPNCDPARAWVIDQGITALDPRPGVLLAVDVADPTLADAVGRHISEVTGDAVNGFNPWLDTRGDLLVESDFFGAFLGAFGVLALVASMVVIAGMITARTWSRRRALAQLRSLGCTRGQVTVALLVEHTLIGVVGCLVGNLGAALAAPKLRIGALGVLDGNGPGLPTAAVIGSTVIVLAMVVIATLLPAVRSGRRDVVAGLGAAPETSGRRWVTGRGFERAPLPVSVALGVRSTFARPLRAALCAASVALAVMTTMVAVSINRTMDDMLAHPELTGDPADASVEPAPGVTVEQATGILDVMPEVARWFSVADETAVVGERSVHVRAIGGDPSSSGYVIGGGSPLVEAGQAIAGYGLLTTTGWHIGQSIHLDFRGRSVDVTLVGWYRETEDSGEVLQIRMEDFLSAHEITSSRFAVHAVSGTTPMEVGSALARGFGDRARVEVNGSDAEHLAPFRIALATMAGLISAVAVANMIAAAIIASRERSRRTGALLAIGMTRRSMFAEAIAATTISVVAAIAIGVPLGWLADRWIGDLLTGQLGAGPGLSLAPQPAQLGVIVVVVAGVAVAVAASAARSVIGRSIPDLLQESA